MEENSSFKVPQIIPQDLLFIQELLGVEFKATKPARAESVTSIDSTDSECSEDEVEADLVQDAQPLSPDDSGMDDSDSDEEEDEQPMKIKPEEEDDVCEDEEGGPSLKQHTYFMTKNEALEADFNVPDIQQVGPEEPLEKVGHILNLVETTVIIKGLPPSVPVRGALDSDTLLVFDDRKVLGYVYDIFGPTAEPLYQVKFKDPSTIDRTQVRVDRDVFHIPGRSRFVFVSDTKGSDASNCHDEEPPDHELDFSDDEAEAEFKRKKRGESRARSVTSSRHATPLPFPPRANAFDEQGPYDDYPVEPSRPLPAPYSDAGPSRPTPLPYDDDPYSAAVSSEDISAAMSRPEIAALRPQRRSRRGRGRGGSQGGEQRPQPSVQDSLMPYDPAQLSFSYSAPRPMPTNFPTGQWQQWPAWNQPAPVMPHLNPHFFPQFGMPMGYPPTQNNFSEYNNQNGPFARDQSDPGPGRPPT
ncbi:Gar1/Naf1 RNA binding region-domain-containing protein [Mycena floridula]|nr:Gar1/Naf1 RNA binding region-domain-containing protein [Mycena floridula]